MVVMDLQVGVRYVLHAEAAVNVDFVLEQDRSLALVVLIVGLLKVGVSNVVALVP